MTAPEEASAQQDAGIANDATVPAEAASEESVSRCRRVKRVILLVLLGIASCQGIAYGIFGETTAANLVTGIVITILCAVWCHYDASQRQYPFPRWLRLLVVLVFAVGFPVYAFKTRGWAGFKLIGWALLILLTCGVLYAVAVELTCWLTGTPLPP